MIRSRIFREVFEQSNVPQIISSTDLSINICNKAFYKFIGYSKEEWELLTVQDISHPEDYEIDFHLMNELVNGKRNYYQIEKRYIHKSGSQLIGTLNVSLITDHESTKQYLFAQIIDCTEKYSIDESLRRSEEKYRLLAEHSSDIILLHNIEGIYQYASYSVYTILGYSPNEMIGKSPYDLIHPNDISNVTNLHYKIVNGVEKGVLTTYRARRKDGTYVWLESNIKGVYDENEKLTELISVTRDVEHRIQTNELLRKSEKLAVVGQMAAAVAHEIRNPLTPIKGFITLLSKTKEYNPNFIEIIISELNRIETIISEFLQMAKPAPNKIEPLHIDKLVMQVASLLHTEAILESKEINIRIDSTIPRILGDENTLKQVVVNVIRNALESLEKQGKVEVTLSTKESNVCIHVVDNGCGISKERLAKIGEPFYSTKEKGTGLGLMTSFNIIENHGGVIEIESQEGEGTSVMILIPIKYKTRH